MLLSDSTLFADRTMLRSIFIALDAMALLSDACLFFYHFFVMQSYILQWRVIDYANVVLEKTKIV